MALDGDYVPSTRSHVRNQVEVYERSGGTKGNTQLGLPIVIVTMRGAKTRKLRKVALMRVEHEGEYALVASIGGAPKHPLWYHNLVANPEIALQDGPEPVDMTVRLVTGEERDAWWERAVEAFPNYADYQKKTRREIPVFVASAD